MKQYVNDTGILGARPTHQNEISARDGNDLEPCVLCGENTTVRKDTHIDFRDYYIEGCGQLCRGCYISVYHGR